MINELRATVTSGVRVSLLSLAAGRHRLFPASPARISACRLTESDLVRRNGPVPNAGAREFEDAPPLTAPRRIESRRRRAARARAAAAGENRHQGDGYGQPAHRSRQCAGHNREVSHHRLE